MPVWVAVRTLAELVTPESLAARSLAILVSVSLFVTVWPAVAAPKVSVQVSPVLIGPARVRVLMVWTRESSTVGVDPRLTTTV